MIRPNTLLKILAAVVALGILGVLFVRSARSARQAPYSVAERQLTGWSLAIEPPSGGSGRLLSLAPPPELGPALFRQIFSRAGETLNAPADTALPLVLRSEYDRALAGRVSPEALLAAALEAGLDSLALEPRCLAYRRVSEPGAIRQLYFILFDIPAFDRFREGIPAMIQDAGGNPAAFDPSALSPILIMAANDAAFARWLPVRADPETDCLAPIALE